MDTTALVTEQPPVWQEEFLYTYGPAMQAGSFVGTMLLGIAALIAAVALLWIACAVERAVKSYRSTLEGAVDVDSAAPAAEQAPAIDVEEFVE